MMPEMDGFELAERIKQPSRTGIVDPFDAVVGGPAGRCPAAASELGITTYLSKPIKQSELLNAILDGAARVAASRPELRRRRQ